MNDLTGQKFNKLTVVKRSFKKNTNGGTSWECLCDCGNTHTTSGSCLIRNRVKSCGCLKVRPYGIAAMNGYYTAYRLGAKSRNLVFNITIEQFEYLTKQNCYYCGVSPNHIATSANNRLRKIGKSKNDTGNYICNGIDRKDNSIGYLIDNCITCCKQCNISKMAMNDIEFLEWVKRVYNHSIKDKE